VYDPQSLEPFDELLGDHRAPAVGHEGAGKTALLNPLGEPVDEVLVVSERYHCRWQPSREWSSRMPKAMGGSQRPPG